MLVDFGLWEIREIKDFARVQHCFGKCSRFRAVQATNQRGHEPGGYLVVRNFTNGVAATRNSMSARDSSRPSRFLRITSMARIGEASDIFGYLRRKPSGSKSLMGMEVQPFGPWK